MKRKPWKRIAAFFFACCLIVGMAPAVFAADKETDENAGNKLPDTIRESQTDGTDENPADGIVEEPTDRTGRKSVKGITEDTEKQDASEFQLQTFGIGGDTDPGYQMDGIDVYGGWNGWSTDVEGYVCEGTNEFGNTHAYVRLFEGEFDDNASVTLKLDSQYAEHTVEDIVVYRYNNDATERNALDENAYAVVDDKHSKRYRYGRLVWLSED